MTIQYGLNCTFLLLELPRRYVSYAPAEFKLSIMHYERNKTYKTFIRTSVLEILGTLLLFALSLVTFCIVNLPGKRRCVSV